MPPQAAHTGPLDSLLKIGEYNGYIVEYRPQPRLEDEVTRTLDENFKSIGKELGEDGIYINLQDIKKDTIPNPISREYTKYPILAVFEEHPAVCVHNELINYTVREPGENIEDKSGILENRFNVDEIPHYKIEDPKCLVFELGDLNKSTEVTNLLKLLIQNVQEEEFMTDLTWKKRKKRIKRMVEEQSGIVSIGISILSI